MRKSLFSAGLKNSDAGFTDGKIVCFEVAEAFNIVRDHNERCEFKIYYNEDRDAFWQPDVENQKLRIWKGKNYETADGIKHLYNIELKWREVK